MLLTKSILWINFAFIYTMHILVATKAMPSLMLNLSVPLAALVFVVFIFEALRNNKFDFPVKYVLFSVVLIFLIIISAIVNEQRSGAILLGLKTYFPMIPFFLLPFACNFDSKDMKPFLFAFLVLALLQFPLSFYQRFILFGDSMHTGDVITGTLGLSSYLSMYLLCTLAVLMGFLLRKKLKLVFFLAILPVLFAPTTINETKGTLFLLPIALIGPAVAHAIFEKRIMHLLPIGIFVSLGFAGFIAMFNFIESSAGNESFEERSLLEYSFMGRKVEVDARDTPVIGKRKVNRERDVGRGDSMLYAFKAISKDPFTLVMGKGLGNLTESSIDILKGDFERYEHLLPMYTVVSILTWELGVIGLLMALWINYSVFRDTWHVAKSDTAEADFALGWLAVIVILTMAMFYKNLIWGSVLSSFYWFFSGYFCALRVRSPAADTVRKVSSSPIEPQPA